MNKPGMTSHQSIQIIGEGAFQILSDTKQGRVLACVTGAIYLVTSQDEVVWVIPEGKMMHTRGILVTGLMHGLEPGMSFSVNDHSLVLNSSHILDFSQSLIWKSPSMVAIAGVPSPQLFPSLITVIDQLLREETPAGFGCLIKPVLQDAGMDQGSTEENNIPGVAGKSWQSVKGIIQAFITGDNLLWMNCAKSLVGLGEGLTPSGDDFLGGFIFASRLLSQTIPVELIIHQRTYSEFIGQAKSDTNPISYTMLKDHARGYSLEPLSHFATGLLQEKPTSQLYDYAKQLISIGHSTGWDILAGFIAGMVSNQKIYRASLRL